MLRIWLPLLALLTLLPARAADAQVRRCQLPTGQTVYTDRKCEHIGAAERAAAPVQAQVRGWRMGCPRTLRDLYFEVSAALESQDANRLASVYHFAGMSTRQGYDVMRRLQAIVDRPLVDLQPVYPGGDDGLYATGQRPVAFRIEQTAKNGSTPMRSVLGLRRHLECWWVTLGGGAPVRRTPVETPAPVPQRMDAQTTRAPEPPAIEQAP